MATTIKATAKQGERWVKYETESGSTGWCDSEWAGTGEMVIYRWRAARDFGRHVWIRAHIVNGIAQSSSQHPTLKAAMERS